MRNSRGPGLAGVIRLAAVVLAGAAASCGDANAAYERLAQARQLSADLLIQFTKAADESDRAVMADTDEVSVKWAHDAGQTKGALQHDVEALGPLLQQGGYARESEMLQEFVSRFREFDDVDRRILELAVENSNLKAQRLSYGPAQDAADAVRDALGGLAAATPDADRWHVQALVGQAVTTVREIQVLQAPHIAAADDAVMKGLEARMATSETGARQALSALAALVPPALRPRVAAATQALDEFMRLNAQIITLSRQNTNVRSLALSLKQKPALEQACEEPLRRLGEALARRVPAVAR
jgi:hypothetical protein